MNEIRDLSVLKSVLWQRAKPEGHVPLPERQRRGVGGYFLFFKHV